MAAPHLVVLQLVLEAAVAYIAGLVLHELTHGIVVVLTDAHLTDIRMSLNSVSVHYKARGAHIDQAIRMAPVVGVVPLAAACGLWLASTPTLETALLVFGLLAGYMPRSPSDLGPARRLWRKYLGLVHHTH